MDRVTQSRDDERDEIRRLVRELGEAGGARAATLDAIHRLRDFFGRHVLRSEVDDYIIRKYWVHVEIQRQWPEDTSPEEFLESLRQTVLDRRSRIYLTDQNPAGEWAIYFSGRVRLAWRGQRGSERIVVLFNAERHRFISSFQPARGDAYVDRQGGFWLYRS